MIRFTNLVIINVKDKSGGAELYQEKKVEHFTESVNKRFVIELD